MGRNPITINSGIRYGHLVTTGGYVPSRVVDKKMISSQVQCICECGCICSKAMHNLTSGQTNCCGNKCIYFVHFKHGKSYTTNGKAPKEYTAWVNMLNVCNNPNYQSYKYIGAKGITYHESFSTIEGFLEIIGKAPSKYHRFSRIDKDRDFEPGNVHWYLANKRKYPTT